MLNADNKKKLLNQTDIFDGLNFFESSFNDVVSIYDDNSPALIKKRIRESINSLTSNNFNHSSPNHFHLVIIDNLKFLNLDNGHNSKKLAIDDLCLNIMQSFRKNYNIIPIIIQHEAESSDDVVIKFNGDVIDNKLKPSLAKLGDSKDTSAPSTHVIALFNPHRFGIPNYPKGKNGFDITKFENNIRFLIPLKLRDSSYENLDLPLHFKGNVSAFEEMPSSIEFQTNPNLYKNYST